MTNKFLEAMDEVENITLTENGAVTNRSTKNACLDLFAIGSSARSLRRYDIEKLILSAYNENPDKCMKILFHIRDIRGGSGEREFFKIAMDILLQYNKTKSIKKNLKHIPVFGRWDDLYIFSYTKLWDKVVEMFKSQIENDLKDMEAGNPVSLLAKWLKSENASSSETIRLAKNTYKSLGYTAKEYRKTLAKLRKYLKVAEVYISKKQYAELDYSKISSRALYKYRKAFNNNDEKRYNEFLDKANSGEVKINTDNIFPHELVREYYKGSGLNMATETTWKNLPNYAGNNNNNAICVCDVSGSMECMGGIPMNVSIAMGIYFAERNVGVFKDRFITFSTNPEIIKLQGENLYEKVRFLKRANWSMSTNIQAVFDLILNMGLENNVPQKDMPKVLYIISDMEFDSAEDDKTNFEKIKEKYINSGYEMPTLVFWNVNAKQVQFPTVMNDKAILVSGFSPMVFQTVVEGLSPVEYMNSIVESERYKDIKA